MIESKWTSAKPRISMSATTERDNVINRPDAANPNGQPDNRKVAKEFESMFVGQVVQELMRSVDFGPMNGGFGANMWRSFLADSISEKFVAKGGLGMADNIERILNAYRR